MELGNMVFGNSRGQFPIKRGRGWEEQLIRLFDAYAPSRNHSWRDYGEEFKNKVFKVSPYYWGDCTCGFDDKEFKGRHGRNCYQSELRREKIKAGWKIGKYDWLEGKSTYEENQKIEDKICKKLCKKHKLSFPGGCAVHCTCDYYERYNKWLDKIGYPEGHTKKCLLEKPNFLYKPTGFEINWYKYPLRDSYKNQKISLKEFKKIIKDCIKSLK